MTSMSREDNVHLNPHPTDVLHEHSQSMFFIAIVSSQHYQVPRRRHFKKSFEAKVNKFQLKHNINDKFLVLYAPSVKCT